MANAADRCGNCGHVRASHMVMSVCITDECECPRFVELPPATEEELQAYDRAVHQPMGPAEFKGFDYGRG